MQVLTIRLAGIAPLSMWIKFIPMIFNQSSKLME